MHRNEERALVCECCPVLPFKYKGIQKAEALDHADHSRPGHLEIGKEFETGLFSMGFLESPAWGKKINILLKNSVNTKASIFGYNSVSGRQAGASHVITGTGIS